VIRRADLVINALPPNDQIYDFKGNMQSGTDDDVSKIEPLSLENTLWQNTVLASSGFVVACIVYTGKETRSEMNAKSPTMKLILAQSTSYSLDYRTSAKVSFS